MIFSHRLIRSLGCVPLLLTLAATLAPRSAQANTLTVTSLADDLSSGTLRAKIAVATVGDTIVFQNGLSGTLTLNGSELLVQKNLTIQGPGAGVLAISANNTGRVFHFKPPLSTPNLTLAVSDLTITGGNVSDVGGGIYNESGCTLTLSNIVVSGNKAVTTANNGGRGGGIGNSGSLTLNNSIVDNNTASSVGSTVGYTGWGGGIYNSSLLIVNNSTISNNTASTSYYSGGYGGGIYNSNVAQLSNSTFSKNNSSTSYLYDYSSGGGIYNVSDVTIKNCTISGNSSTGSSSPTGGGVYNNGNLSITNSTIANNMVSSASGATGTGGGITIYSSGTKTLFNSIVANNTAPSGGPDISGSFSSDDYNWVGNIAGASISGIHNITGIAPQLQPLADNGGPTQTIALPPDSLAIDAGDPNFDSTNTPYDQRGAGYLRIRGGRVDIGALESFINKPPVASDASFSFAQGHSISGAQLSATDADGDSITFGTTDTLPDGVTLNADGSLTGIPTALTVAAGVNITVTATDSHGASDTATVNIKISDTVKPTVVELTPFTDQNLLITSFKAGSITGTASDDNTVTSVKMKLSRLRSGVVQNWNGTAWVTATATIPAAITGSGTTINWAINSLFPPQNQLDEGQYIILIYANDAAGNTATVTSRVNLFASDTTVPVTLIGTPTLNQKVLITNFGTGSVTGIATDNLGVTFVRIKLSRKRGTTNYYWNGTAFTTAAVLLNATITPAGGSNIKWNLDSQMPPASALDSGLYQVDAYAMDVAGNKSATITRPFTLGTDFTTPSVAIVAPTSGQKIDINAFGAGTVNGTAADNIGVTRVALKLSRKRAGVTTYWDGATWTTTAATVDTTVTGTTSATWSFDSKVPTPATGLDAGAYTLYASSYDAVGNTKTSASRSFTLTGTATSAPASAPATSSAGDS